ncbi:MAG: CorA family divalent cation transporter [Methyloceanibacter sp.]
MVEKPGSLADGADGRTPIEALPGLAWAYRFHPNGITEELAVDQPVPEPHAGGLWLHFDLADARAAQSLRSISNLSDPAKDLLVADDEHQQLHADDTCIYGVFADLVSGPDAETWDISFLHFAMNEKVLVSSRRDAVHAVDATRHALREGRKIPSVAVLFEAIVEHVVDAVEDYSDDLAETLDDIEERILGEDVSDERLVLGRMRRTIVRLHRQLAMSRSLLHRFDRDETQPAKPILRLATEGLTQRLDWLDTEIVALRDRAHLLQEEVSLKATEETNRHLEVLSIVATVFLPATLVAGIFGMNVKGLPLTEVEYGLIGAMGIIGGVSALVYWWLRRTGVLGR